MRTITDHNHLVEQSHLGLQHDLNLGLRTDDTFLGTITNKREDNHSLFIGDCQLETTVQIGRNTIKRRIAQHDRNTHHRAFAVGYRTLYRALLRERRSRAGCKKQHNDQRLVK